MRTLDGGLPKAVGAYEGTANQLKEHRGRVKSFSAELREAEKEHKLLVDELHSKMATKSTEPPPSAAHGLSIESVLAGEEVNRSFANLDTSACDLTADGKGDFEE
eukprot:243673-Pyramimonas_sp.AAC.1